QLLSLPMHSPFGLALGLAASGNALAQGACSTSDAVASSWGSGAQIDLSVTNNGPAIDGWELCWTFSGGETIANLWNGQVTTSGSSVCVTDAGSNAALPSNGSVSFGFNINGAASQAPVNFTLNGASCAGANVSSSTASSASSSTNNKDRKSTRLN